MQMHDVDRLEPRQRAGEHRRHDREIFRDVVSDRERGQRAAGHQQLLADGDDLDQLARIRIEIDHVAGFFRGLRAGIHRQADIRLSKRGRVVRPIAHHGDELSFALLLPQELEFGFRSRFGDEIVDSGLVVLEDILKPGMRDRFERLRKMGLRTVMVTGDNPLTAKAIAGQAGVDDFIAQATPEASWRTSARSRRPASLWP